MPQYPYVSVDPDANKNGADGEDPETNDRRPSERFKEEAENDKS
jgi:hypothetical protein